MAALRMVNWVNFHPETLMLKHLALCTLSVLLAFPALAAETYPAPVQKAIAEMDKMCTAVGGTPENADTLVLKLDLNNDSTMDYVLNEGAYYCNGAASLFGGTAGHALTAYVSEASGDFASAWSGMVYGAKLSETIPPTLWVDLGGEPCGQKGEIVYATMDTCSRALTWDETTHKLELGATKPIEQPE